MSNVDCQKQIIYIYIQEIMKHVCRYPTDQVPPHIRLSPRQEKHTVTCPITPNHVFLLRRAPTLPRVPCSGSCLPDRKGSDAAMCHVAPNPSSLLMRALALPRVPRLWILPPCSGGLRHCHVSHGSGSYFPAREGSSAAMCPTAPDPASPLGRAPMLPRVPWLSMARRSQE
jgi:hypothetical protein